MNIYQILPENIHPFSRYKTFIFVYFLGTPLFLWRHIKVFFTSAFGSNNLVSKCDKYCANDAFILSRSIYDGQWRIPGQFFLWHFFVSQFFVCKSSSGHLFVSHYFVSHQGIWKSARISSSTQIYARVSIDGQINAPTKICRRRNADEKLCYEEMSCEDSFGYHDIYVISKSRFTADLLNQAKNPNYQKTINICLSVTEVSSNIRLTYVESKIYCHNSHLLP